ncbi:putative molybdenum cofactor biosynthesis protein D2 (MoaD2) / thiamineS [Rhodococcoides trifolii]|uniref:Molybdenum cofactor biosynthesis protein D2 (MoaD2) / thiamineS n=1 Tax=Rhodococcoides trifolii TaxID=908250 RepID=A0A917D158_9NOCA|nr:putative molybdenum cofactor biosynthesis protein D2 (MoaD2) / thiamineS [Rhodococcus trifolii]
MRYFAAAADAAGTEKETVSLPDGADLAQLSAVLSDSHGSKLAEILSVSAFLVGDDLTRDRSVVVGPRVDVLPPFAGG